MPAISLKFFIVLLSAPIYPSFLIYQPSKTFNIPIYNKNSSKFFSLHNKNRLDNLKIPYISFDEIKFRPLNVNESIAEIENSIFTPLLIKLNNKESTTLNNIFNLSSLSGAHEKQLKEPLLKELKRSLRQKTEAKILLFAKYKKNLMTLQKKVVKQSNKAKISDDEKKALLSFLILFEDLQALEKQFRAKLNVINNEDTAKVYVADTNEVKEFVGKELDTKFKKANWDPELMLKFWNANPLPDFSLKNQFVDQGLINIYNSFSGLASQTEKITKIKAEIKTLKESVEKEIKNIGAHNKNIEEAKKINISTSTEASVDNVNEYEEAYKTAIKTFKKQESKLIAKNSELKNKLKETKNSLPKEDENNKVNLLKIQGSLDEVIAENTLLEKEIKGITENIAKFEKEHVALRKETDALSTFIKTINTLLSSHKTISTDITTNIAHLKTVSDNCEDVANSHFSDTKSYERLSKEKTNDGPELKKLQKLKKDMQEFLAQITSYLNINDTKSNDNFSQPTETVSVNFTKMNTQYWYIISQNFLDKNILLDNLNPLTEEDHEWIGKNCIYQNNKINLRKLTTQKAKFDSIIKIIKDNSKLSELSSIKQQLTPIVKDFNFYWTQVKKINGKYSRIDVFRKVNK